MTTTHFPTWLFFFFNLPSSHAAHNRKKTEYYVSPPSTLHLLHSLSRYLPSFSSFEIFNDHHHQGHRYNVLTDINLIINGGKRRSHGWCFWGLQRSRRTGHRGLSFPFSSFQVVDSFLVDYRIAPSVFVFFPKFRITVSSQFDVILELGCVDWLGNYLVVEAFIRIQAFITLVFRFWFVVLGLNLGPLQVVILLFWHSVVMLWRFHCAPLLCFDSVPPFCFSVRFQLSQEDEDYKV